MFSVLLLRTIVSSTVSPTEYSPIRLESEPATPILTPLTAVMISFSLSPALSPALSGIMAELFLLDEIKALHQVSSLWQWTE